MKTKILAFAASALLVGVVSPARADLEVSVGVRVSAVADFYTPLEAHGSWVEVRGHGRCWRPRTVAVGWRPYCDGHWEWTELGWYWESDEPWAWASYHYGSWVDEPGFGWVWVPGIEWAPAWVSWRVGGGHCGWAPLAPRGVVVRETHFVFVEERRFHERIRPTTVIVNNNTIIRNTTVVNVKRETRNIGGSQRTVVVNEGPKVEVVQRASGQRFAAKPIQEVARRTEEKAPPTIRRQAGTRDAQRANTERPNAEQPNAARPNTERPRDVNTPRETTKQNDLERRNAERRDAEKRDIERRDAQRRDGERRDAERRVVRERREETPRISPVVPRAPEAPRPTPDTPRAVPGVPRDVPEARRPVPESPRVAPQPERQPETRSEKGDGQTKPGNPRPKDNKGHGRDREDGR